MTARARALALCFAVAVGFQNQASAQEAPAEALLVSEPESLLQSSVTTSELLDEQRDIHTQQIESIRSFYIMVKDSCSEVVATIADTCEIYRIGTEANVSETKTMGRRINVTGTVTMKVKFKAGLSKP